MAHEDKPLGSYAALKERVELPLNTTHTTVKDPMRAAFAAALEKKEKGK